MWEAISAWGSKILSETCCCEYSDRSGLTLCILVPSADDHCKPFGPRLGPTVGPDLGPNCLALMVFLKKYFFIKLILNIINRRQKSCKITQWAKS